MSLILYHFPVSSASRSVLLLARHLGIPIEVKLIDLFKKEQHKADFLKLNPQHTVPTINDNGFILWESRAILRYLATKYSKDDQLYPQDLKKRATVESRLDFDCSSLYQIYNICFPILFKGVKEINPELKKDFNKKLGFLNIFLKNSKWVAGNHLTIADIAVFTSITTVLSIDWTISEFSEIERWFDQFEDLPGKQENLEGATIFGEIMKTFLLKD